MLDAVRVAELKPLSIAPVPDEIIRRLKLTRACIVLPGCGRIPTETRLRVLLPASPLTDQARDAQITANWRPTEVKVTRPSAFPQYGEGRAVPAASRAVALTHLQV